LVFIFKNKVIYDTYSQGYYYCQTKSRTEGRKDLASLAVDVWSSRPPPVPGEIKALNFVSILKCLAMSVLKEGGDGRKKQGQRNVAMKEGGEGRKEGIKEKDAGRKEGRNKRR
jgi:hypothetical protein